MNAIKQNPHKNTQTEPNSCNRNQKNKMSACPFSIPVVWLVSDKSELKYGIIFFACIDCFWKSLKSFCRQRHFTVLMYSTHVNPSFTSEREKRNYNSPKSFRMQWNILQLIWSLFYAFVFGYTQKYTKTFFVPSQVKYIAFESIFYAVYDKSSLFGLLYKSYALFCHRMSQSIKLNTLK